VWPAATGKKEVHAPVNRTLRKRIRDTAAQKVTAEAQTKSIMSTALAILGGVIVLVVGMALYSVYGDALNDLIRDSIPTGQSSAFHWIGYARNT
jgi:hypothetical protein